MVRTPAGCAAGAAAGECKQARPAGCMRLFSLAGGSPSCPHCCCCHCCCLRQQVSRNAVLLLSLSLSQMVLLPKWSVTRRLVRSPLVLAPLGLVYGLLLVWSWQPDSLSLILPGSLADGLTGELRRQGGNGLAGWRGGGVAGQTTAAARRLSLPCWRREMACSANAALSGATHRTCTALRAAQCWRPRRARPTPAAELPTLPAVPTPPGPPLSPTPAPACLACPAGGFSPQFMPSLEGICTLFSRWLTAASLWVHLLAANLFAAREMYLEGAPMLPAQLPSCLASPLACKMSCALWTVAAHCRHCSAGLSG